MNQLIIPLSLPDGEIADHTPLLRKALEDCRDAGGGEVILQTGQWHIGSVRIYSNTTLRLSSGAKLNASADWRDYEDFHVQSTLGYLHSPWVIKAWNLPTHYIVAPIVAFDAENVAVIGEPGSIIDGSDCYDPAGEEKFRGPMGMVFSGCRGVTLMGYTYRRAANWAHQMDSCTNVLVENVTVLGGHDGINIHHCTGVRIENCDFRTGDDCVAGYDAENVVIRDCSFNTSCSSFRFGGRNLLVENCRFYGPGEYPHRVSGRHNTLCLFEYYAMRYDTCRFNSGNWRIRNCTIDGIDRLINYRHSEDWMHEGRPLEDVTFENVTVLNLLEPAVLKASPGNPLHLALKNVTMRWRQGADGKGMFITTPEVNITLENVTIDGFNG